MIPAAMIKVKDLRKSYSLSYFSKKRVLALKGFSFEAHKPSIIGIIGPNGAGKTTFFKLLVGLITPTSGEVEIHGYSPRDAASRRQIGYLPEVFHLPQFFTPKRTLDLVGKLYNIPKERLLPRIHESLEFVNLSEWGNVEVGKLSKGMLQRLGIAQALLPDPSILILDEPLDGIDAEARHSIKTLLKSAKDHQKLVLLSSHILTDVDELCDEIVFLNRGTEICKLNKADIVSQEKYIVKIDGKETDSERLKSCHTKFSYVNGFYRAEIANTLELTNTLQTLRDAGINISAVTTEKQSLEEFYLNLLRNHEEAT